MILVNLTNDALSKDKLPDTFKVGSVCLAPYALHVSVQLLQKAAHPNMLIHIIPSDASRGHHRCH